MLCELCVGWSLSSYDRLSSRWSLWSSNGSRKSYTGKDQAVNQILPNNVKGQCRSMYKTVVKSKKSYSRSIRPWGHICYYTITQQSSQPSHPDPYTVIICKQLVAGPQEKKSGALPTIKLPQAATKSGAMRSIFTNGLLVLFAQPTKRRGQTGARVSALVTPRPTESRRDAVETWV